ncbi:nitric oxide-sensing transcriptional repressor NsrR [Bacillus sp. NEAU-CP5]|jgi:Rrf2 family nitric oxide-sensitive transcriptional repressor|uniref:nitric oxide-sensing transcriptional repressor NsrR n=1 Tax=Bacillus TaxID=1386 RepID=UPI0004588D9C|nr:MULTISPECIES: nitric oxide-sensing transcriptional repressor NsrR [Bacillus]AIW36805.1 Rrf2 family transcriptional regulator [Bacillus subtilis]ARM27163.1 Rrf2 family transcriptional regulator [Bacillus vallismortis]AHZ14925.1 HTH-type transcriptional regulator iscR [Bacillus velezensis SQR9]AKF77290.1 Rrf2 family transcriptional regulator [Bacillus velezensis]ANF35833.1 rrf2 family transcriptional regulator [Bacillus velezensis]
MKLTNYTDYSLRVLIFLASKHSDELSNIKEIADTYSISKNHLMKVIYRLGQLGYVETIRGRGGGIRLGMTPEDINIGEVVRNTEDDFNIVECFDSKKNLCIISPACNLKNLLNEALQAYLAVLDKYTLRDLVKNKEEIMRLLRS